MQWQLGIDLKLIHFLVVSGVLFCIGIYGVLSRRHLVQILMSVELILNAVLINLIAFSSFTTPDDVTGQKAARHHYSTGQRGDSFEQKRLEFGLAAW